MNAGRTVLTILLLAMAACVDAQELPAAELNIVPRPAKIKMLPGAFLLTGETRIVAADRESRRIAGLFNDFLLEQHGLRLEIVAHAPRTSNYIVLQRSAADASRAEAYRLEVHPEAIRLSGDAAGLFYGLQTLRQLLPLRPAARIEVPALEIEDRPRFGYRGVLLDVGRHFFSVAYLAASSLRSLSAIE